MNRKITHGGSNTGGIMALTKNDIVEKITDKLEFSRKDSLDLLEAVISIMKQTLASGEDIKISGFGKFEVKQKADRRGRNPQTGEALIIEARRIITFKPSGLLRDAINK
jgi:integration host factor subunit alpha